MAESADLAVLALEAVPSKHISMTIFFSVMIFFAQQEAI
jgi:hypothetical protein